MKMAYPVLFSKELKQSGTGYYRSMNFRWIKEKVSSDSNRYLLLVIWYCARHMGFYENKLEI